jgi:hypothetical protein
VHMALPAGPERGKRVEPLTELGGRSSLGKQPLEMSPL